VRGGLLLLFLSQRYHGVSQPEQVIRHVGGRRKGSRERNEDVARGPEKIAAHRGQADGENQQSKADDAHHAIPTSARVSFNQSGQRYAYLPKNLEGRLSSDEGNDYRQ